MGPGKYKISLSKPYGKNTQPEYLLNKNGGYFIVDLNKIKVNESLCPKDLEAKYLQKALPEGSRYDSIAFASDYTDKKAARIASQLETAIWQGSTGSANVNLNKFQGLVTLIGTSAVEANNATYYGGTATAITTANVVAIFDALYKAIPAPARS